MTLNLLQMIDVRLVNSEVPTPSSTPESSDADEDEDEVSVLVRMVGYNYLWL
jgi:hypothetical protein